jgi:hypothetical protein
MRAQIGSDAMNDRNLRRPNGLLFAAALAFVGATSGPARAQDAAPAGPAPAAAPGPIGASPEPSPYYIGASEGLTHDSNVYRIPFGPSDNYSTTTLLGGFDQHIGRQHLFGNADVGLNRYANQTQLDNTSYDLTAGLDWETLHDLAGNLGVALSRRLSAPAASPTLPNASRNMAQTENLNARVTWGGPSVMSIDATLGYLKIDYSNDAYAASDSRQTSASLGAHYRARGPLRVGIAGRIVDTRAPQAFVDPLTGAFQANTVRSDNLDLLVDYDLTGLLTANARLSYTKQTNSVADTASFSGLTGSLGLVWRSSGRTSLQLELARDAGFDATRFSTFSLPPDGSPPTASVGQYENSRVTDSANLRINYSVTAKIDAYAGASYVRADLESTLVDAAGNVTGPGETDSLRTAFLGANYAFARDWTLACKLERDYRHVSGAFAYAYGANTIGCTARYQLRL